MLLSLTYRPISHRNLLYCIAVRFILISYVSRGVGVRKVSIAEVTYKVIQGHWQWCHSIVHIRFPISVPLKTLPLSCTANVSYFPELTGHVTLNTSFRGHALVLCKKFDLPSCTNSKHPLTTPVRGNLSSHNTSTCYILPAYEISRLSLQPFRRHDCGRRK